MRWPPKPEGGWNRHFAVLPTKMDDGTTVWLERYWSRPVRNFRGHVIGFEWTAEYPL